MALISPISRVRSFTATNIIFMRPIAAPINVINPINAAAVVILPRLFVNASTILSLLSTKKLFSYVKANFLIGLKVPVASPMAISMSLILGTMIPIFQEVLEVVNSRLILL